MSSFKNLVRQKFEENFWRVTPAVLKVVHLLENAEKPLSVNQILGQIKPKINTTTVYRIFEKLLAIGGIHEIGGKYLLCSAPENKKEEHHFLICKKCGSAEEIFLNYRESIEKQLATEKNFILYDVDLKFYGTCGSCR